MGTEQSTYERAEYLLAVAIPPERIPDEATRAVLRETMRACDDVYHEGGSPDELDAAVIALFWDVGRMLAAEAPLP